MVVVISTVYGAVGSSEGVLRAEFQSRRMRKHSIEASRAGAEVPLTAEAGAWEVWPWDKPASASVQQLCKWATLAPPLVPGLPRANNGSICLRAKPDLLCDVIAAVGYWPDCADLPELFARSTAETADEGTFVDVGANVGACSMHMLLSSPAPVLTFEPGATNRFFLTSSLLQLAAERPEMRARCTLFPLAAGDSNSSQLLHPAIGNAGHSVLGSQPTLYAYRGFGAAESVLVRTLDRVVWPSLGPSTDPYSGQYPWSAEQGRVRPRPIGLLKLDVEGFECKVLDGMRALLAARLVRTLKVEVFDYGLRAQGCTALELQARLVRAGFALYLAPAEHMPGASSLARAVPVAADRVHSASPYNLYAIQKQGPPLLNGNGGADDVVETTRTRRALWHGTSKLRQLHERQRARHRDAHSRAGSVT